MTHVTAPVGVHEQRTPLPARPDQPPRDARLLKVAQKLESSFISEMLKSAGFGKPRDAFGGGAGEEGFSSFLVHAQADKIVEAGGFGLAEKIYLTLRGNE